MTFQDKTDWDSYYRKPTATASITRKITQTKISWLLKRFTNTQSITSICEFGGANSCVLEAVCRAVTPTRYHVIDFNQVGLYLLPATYLETMVSSENLDIAQTEFQTRVNKFDIVFSIGLIEHFEKTETRKVVENHFSACADGGLVLITFPTPTLPYRLIRQAAERLGLWAFPDERPLDFAEVEHTCVKYGTIVHKSINWWIGLTQGYILIRKEAQ